MPFHQILLILLITAAADWLLLRYFYLRKQKDGGSQFPRIQKDTLLTLISFFLLILSQVIVNLDEPIIVNEHLSGFINSTSHYIRLDLPYLENNLIAVFLMILAPVLFIIGRKDHIRQQKPSDQTSPVSPDILQSKQSSMQFQFAAFSGISLFIILLIRMYLLKVSLLDPIIWLLVILMTGFAIIVYDKQRHGGLTERKISRKDLSLVLFLVAGGLLVSSFKLTTHPNQLMGDEGNFFDTARAIAIGEYLPSFFDMGVYSYPVASSYWQGFIMSLFGISLWSWRFSSVLIGVLAVIPLYFLGLDMFGRRIAILASTCLLVSPYFLAFARLGYNNSQVFLPVTISIWMLYGGWKKKSPLLIFLGGLAAGLGFLAYTAARIAFVIGLAILAAGIVRSLIMRSQRVILKTYTLLMLFFIAGWMIAAGPHLVFSSQTDPLSFRYKTLESIMFNIDAASGFFTSGEIFSISPGWQVEPYQLFFHPGIYAWLILRGLLRTILAFFIPGLMADHFVVSPLTGPISSIFLLLGLFVCFSRMREKRSILLLTWFFLVIILLSAMNTFPPRHTHMVPVIPVMALLSAVGIDALVEAFSKRIIRVRTHTTVRCFLLAFAAFLFAGAGLYQYYTVVPRVFKPDLDQVMNWAQLSNNENIPFVYITNREGWENWTPFVIGRFVPFRSSWVLTEQKFLNDRYTLPRFEEAVYIFHSENSEKIAEKIRRDFRVEKPPLRILDRSGMIIGGMAIKGGFVWPVHTSLTDDLFSLLRSPSGFLSLFLIIPGVILHIYSYPPGKVIPEKIAPTSRR